MEPKCSIPVHNSLLHVPNLRQFNVGHTPSFYFLKIHFNIMLCSNQPHNAQSSIMVERQKSDKQLFLFTYES